jgi:hypothetical protein
MRCGPVEFTLDGSSWPITLSLFFSDQLQAAGLLIPNDVTFWILPTQPTYGGERWWLVCPACGERCELRRSKIIIRSLA